MAEAEERIKAAWAKWKEMSGMVCDRKTSIKLNLKMYKALSRRDGLGCVRGAQEASVRERRSRSRIRSDGVTMWEDMKMLE